MDVIVPAVGTVDVEIERVGDGPPFLLLHGAAGPSSMRGFAELLASRQAASVIVPTHPGFALTDRPADPQLGGRLGELEIPTLVIWGESDGIVDTAYGRAYSEAIPGSRFAVLPDAGHMPQIENAELLLEAIRADGLDAR